MTKTPEELTKDWKAGKLEYGRYWIKNKVWEKPFIDRWLPNCSWEISCKDAIEQVLAPVPTYDEYKAMQKELAELKEKIKKREELIQCLEVILTNWMLKNRFLSLKTTSSEDC